MSVTPLQLFAGLAPGAPQGPAQAVLVAEATTSQGPAGSAGAGGMASASGWPANRRVRSGSGPRGPFLSGVWQSMQPVALMR